MGTTENFDKGFYLRGMELLVEVVQQLSLARSLQDVVGVTRRAARQLTGADGASFVLRDGDRCYYVDEDAIEPLWKGRKFPMSACVSGWAMINGKNVVIPDIYQDPRVPTEAYRPTFVKSLAMVPIRERKPVGAIGNYWAQYHEATASEMKLLKALADATSVALENIKLVGDLQKANAVLNESVRARDEFLAVASHELRTPISVLKLQLQMAERQIKPSLNMAPTPQRQKEANELALRQVGNLQGLVENLLDVSRLRLQRLELKTSQFDLAEAVQQGFEASKASLQNARCQVELDLEEGIAGTWDFTRISQIVSNLLSNVSKYAAGKHVKITTRNQTGTVVMTVQDNGPGIRPEIQQKIFDCFERGASADNVSGLGFGLFITKRLVEAHDGQIDLESKEGHGAKFTLQLPCNVQSNRLIV